MTDPRKRIQKRLAELGREDAQTAEDRAIVKLDQQSVGRLSRMDAMQQQAMANATYQRRQNEKLRLTAALTRLDQGEYGYCLECGAEIPSKKLELDPSLANCITCARS